MEFKDMLNIFMDTQAELKARLKDILIKEYGEQNVIDEDGFLYAKGTHPVLLVAHLDTVHKKPPRDIYVNLNRTRLQATEGIGGDDRCGVIIILEVIKKHKCSVVFCEDEEIGGVGAGKFGDMNYNLNVNYAVEFDRKGSNDYVFYKTANKEFEEHIKQFGFVKAYGSYSDISDIARDYEIEAVNISSGYYNPHTTSEIVDLKDMEDIIARATKMIGTPTEKFEYEKPQYQQMSFGKSYYYDDDYYSDYRRYGSYCEPTKRYPMTIYQNQAILKINGKITKFDSATIDEKNNIYDIVYKKRKIKTRDKDRVEFWDEQYNWNKTYWSFIYKYPDQEQKPKNNSSVKTDSTKKNKSNITCYFCGGAIAADDEIGKKHRLCESCRETFYGDDDYFASEYYYE